jgi:hypothetical protein
MVTDISGRTVKVMDLKKEHKEYLTNLQLNGIKPGGYYLFLNMKNGKSLSAKFIKR